MRRSLCNLVFYLICILFSLSLWGQKRINIEQAEKVAENIASSFTSGKARGSKLKLNLVHISTKSGTNKFKTLTTNDEVYYYVFNVNTNDGFVVVSGNDIAIPVLVYSNEGGYNEKDIPPALAWWMNQYKQEIQYALDHKIPQDKETKAKWADFTAGAPQSTSPKIKNRSSYTPGTNLIETKWDQGVPYNEFIKSKLGIDYPTGCGATVMAQVMNYWKHPAKTLAPIPSYITYSLKLNVPGVAAGTPIDWDNMADIYDSDKPNYTPIQVKAVSELMYYVGVAKKMDYNRGGSSSYVFESGKALKNYFGYNAKWIDKRNHPANWDYILKAQIDALQPIIYSGFDSKANGGHGFVCDGYEYQNGILYFHFNWGWGGSGDNYCTTSALIPGAYDHNFSDYQTITIDIKPIDSNSPTNLTTTHITPSGAQLNWTPVNGALNYTVEYKTSATLAWSDPITVLSTNHSLGSLTANTAYSWRVKANFSSFSSDYTESYFTTSYCFAPSMFFNFVTTTNSASVTWVAVEGSQDYTVEYKISTDTDWIRDRTSSSFYSFSGLKSNTTYNWKVRTNCSATSSSNFSSSDSFTTKVETCNPPTVLPPASITSSTADLKWNVVSGARDYTVEYKPSTASWTSATTTTIATTNRSLLGLIADTTYDWRIKANCSGSSSSGYTNGTSFKTLVACAAPTGLTTSDPTANSVKLNWTAVSGVQNYTIEYKTSATSTWSTPIPVTSTSYTLEGLTANMTYDWQVKANCSASSSSTYTKGSFKTLTVCNPPTGLAVSDVTSNSAKIMWSGVDIQKSLIEYKPSSATSWKPVTGIFTGLHTLSGLMADTTYDWRIKINCSSSNSSEYTYGESFKTFSVCMYEFEPNETFEAAKSISLNTVYNAGIHKSTDKDYYTFTLSTPSDVVVTLGNLSKNYMLTLFNSEKKEIGFSTSRDTSITKKNLAAGTYYVYVYGASGAFDPTQCYELKVATTATVVCTAPTVLPPASITSSTADLKWNVVSGAQSYTVEYKLSTASWTSATTTTIANTSRSLLGLTADTTYDWRIKANCSGSSSSGYTDGTSFKTLAATVVCNPPTVLPPASITSSTADLKWNVVSGAQSYTVEYKLSTASWTSATTTTIATTNRSLLGLIADTTYDWRIKANCSGSSSSGYTDGTSFKTLAATVVCNPPTVLPPANITSSTADLKWNVVSRAQSYTVEYKLSTASWTSATPITIATTSRSLLGLTADTTYDWRIKANCSGSSSSGYTDGTSFKTLAATVVCNVNAHEPNNYTRTATLIDLNKTYKAGIQKSTDKDYYKFFSGTFSNVVVTLKDLPQNYNLKLINSKGKQVGSLGNKTGTADETITANVLPQETYYVEVIGYNRAFDASQCYTLKVSTGTSTSCTAPTVFPPASITSSTADLKWNVVSGAQSYTVEYKLSTASWTSATTTTIANTSRSLLGLTADTTYDWRIKANCSGSSSSGYTDGTSFKTLAATVVCNPPTVLPPASITSSTADLKWNVVSGAQSYTVEYKLSTASWTSATPITIATTSRSLLGLTAETTYNWRVKTNCSASSSSGYTDGTSFKTLAATVVCNPPTVLPPANITSSTADLKWNVVSGAQSYTVEYKLSTASWTSAITTTITNTSRSLLGLTADTTYDWRIKANCSGSSSSGYTDGTSFKTLAATVVCNPPTVLLPASITSSTADLKWNVVSGAQSYTVEYKLSTASWTSAITTTIATTNRSLLGLTADTTYDWRIKANCSSSSSSGYTYGTSFKTLAATVVCNPGLYEPNNTRKAASLIDLNTTYKAGIQVTLDRDYYKFILSAPSNVVITLENVPENYTFQLLNYLGSYIDSGFMSGNGKTIKRALARGTYYINITAFSRDYDASQCYALRINTPSGSSSPSSNETVVNDKNTILSSNVTLYPNPVDDMINIKGLVSDQEYTQLTIIDRNGGIVKTSQVKVEDIIRVDVSDLSPNIYHLTILGKNFRFIKK